MSLQTRYQVPRHMATTARMSVNYSIMPHCSWVPSHSILDKHDAEIEKEEFGVDISDQYSVNRYVFSVPQSDDNLDDEIEEEEKEEFGVDIYDSLDQEIEEEEFRVDISEYLETSTYYGPTCDDEEKHACYICAYEYEDEDIIGTLHCGHDFHADCAKKWLLMRKKTCPCCSDPVLPIHDSLDKEIEEEEFGVEIYDSLDKEIEEEEFEVEISEYLETRTYYGPMCDDEEKDACFICAYEYEDEDIIGTLHCGHDFHADCAKKWLLTRKKACPVCSYAVLPIQ